MNEEGVVVRKFKDIIVMIGLNCMVWDLCFEGLVVIFNNLL